jgi:hypothetical protein
MMFVRDLSRIKVFQRENGNSKKLRFLAKEFFNETIQMSTHWSLIDATMAMKLYQKYLKMPIEFPRMSEIVVKDYYKPPPSPSYMLTPLFFYSEIPPAPIPPPLPVHPPMQELPFEWPL